MSKVVKSVGGALGLNSSGTPQYQKYDIDAAMRTNNIGVLSDLGDIGLQKQPDGTYARTFTSSANDVQRNNLMADILGNMGDTTGSDKFYGDAAKRINKEFADQRAIADENLINRGIAVGTKQYNDVMGDLADKQNQNLNELATSAIFKGQDLDANRINQANALSAGRDIGLLAGLGQQTNNYENWLAQSNNQQTAKAAGNLAQGQRLLNGAALAATALF